MSCRARGGKRAEESEARDFLAPIHDWFSERFDATDPKDARALLDELAEPRTFVHNFPKPHGRQP